VHERIVGIDVAELASFSRKNKAVHVKPVSPENVVAAIINFPAPAVLAEGAI
jgi:hypothetical protein